MSFSIKFEFLVQIFLQPSLITSVLKASEALFIARIGYRDVTTGVTGATVSPKFSDTLTPKRGRFCPPSQRSQLTFFHGYVPDTSQNCFGFFANFEKKICDDPYRIQGTYILRLQGLPTRFAPNKMLIRPSKMHF